MGVQVPPRSHICTRWFPGYDGTSSRIRLCLGVLGVGRVGGPAIALGGPGPRVRVVSFLVLMDGCCWSRCRQHLVAFDPGGGEVPPSPTFAAPVQIAIRT